MKKTISINLNSFIFNIDEDAYNMLNVYLGKLEEHFLKQEEGAEIVKDIESRIAEIFSMKIKDNKQVINIHDVEEVINILGNVEDITGDEGEKTEEEKNKETKTSKKLYRDPDTKILGGVCGGLAEFTGISIVFWRILFLVFLFVGQVSIIAYLILWIAVPEAKTTAQRIEMKGGKITLSSIEKTVKQEFEDVKKSWRKMNTRKFSDWVNNLGKSLMSIIQVAAQLLGKFIGIAFIIAGAAIITLVTISFVSVGSDNIFYSNGAFSTVWLPGLLRFVTDSGTAWFLSICVLIVFLIPVVAIISWGVTLLFDVRTNKYLGFGTFAIWIVAIIISVALSINIGASFRSLETKVERVDIITDSTNNYSFKISDEHKNFVLPSEDDIESVNDLHIFINSRLLIQNGKKLTNYPDINFRVSDDSTAYVEFKYYARGSNSLQAIENLKSMKYNYTSDTAQIYLDPYVQLNSDLWRGQELRVNVYLPVGTGFIIDKKLCPLVDIDDVSGRLDECDLTGKQLLVTQQGFIIK